MKRFSALTLLLICVLVLSGCDEDRTMSERGFRLPEGDPMAGRETFLYMHCNQCHTIKGEQLPTIPGFEPFVELAEGYATDLVSEDGKSKMYVYNGFMTVQELTDLVMFLQSHYDVVPPEFHYRVYP